MPISIYAEENNIINGLNKPVINRIDDFFLTHPEKKNVILK